MKRVVSVLLILLLAFSAFYSNTESVNAASGSERLKGKDRYATAIEIAKEGWPNGLDSNERAVVLARADDPADALAAASLAGAKDAPILLTSTSSVPNSVMQEIARLGTEKVYVLGGTAAISNNVVSQLSGQGYEVERVSGKNRFSTAAAINEEAGTASNHEAILVNGITVADALSASSYSAINEVPIYLSTKNSIPSELPNSVKEVKIFGGSAVVGSDLESSLKNKGIDVTRLSGKDRFGTNISANKELKASSEDFILVRGYSSSKTKEDYPDAVAASGLANRMDMNIVLTHPTKVLNDVKQFVSNQNGQAYVLGGSGAISQQVVNGLLAKGLFKAHFIYVDQGGSTLLQTPNGKNILIDGGRRGAGEKVLCYLEDHGVESLDLVVATHPDADHIGGLIDVLNEMPVGKVLDSGKSHTSQTYTEYLSIIEQKGIPFEVPEEGSMVNIDPLIDIQILNNGEGASDNNNASIAMKVSYGEIDYLLTGDAEREAEMDMMNEFDLESEIYKVGHHGSDTSSTPAFLSEVSPLVAVISAGIDNRYGHPDSEVIDRLQNAGVSSSLIWELNGEDYVISTGGTGFSASSSTSHCEVPGGTDPEPEPKPDPTQETGDLEITNLNLQEENVTIKNMDSEDISMDGWTLVSVDGNQTYEFPSDYVLRKGENVTLTSGRGAYEDPPGVLEWSGAYLWDNNGDTARLYDPQGELIDEVKR